MYHYVRELPYTRYPKIKGLLVSEFKDQLRYLKKYYTFVTVDECIDVLESGGSGDFPSNAALLTFDDGYIDHFTAVFPTIEAYGIQGCFFPPAKAILDSEVLDVNKIQFLLAATPNIEYLLEDIFNILNKYRTEWKLKSNEYYYSKLAKKTRFDQKEVVFIKRLLQTELDKEIRKTITCELFKKYITIDEQTFAHEL